MHAELYEKNLADHPLTPEARALLEAYDRLSTIGGVPMASELATGLQPDILSWLLVLTGIGHDNFRYDGYGSEVARLMGFDMKGRTITDFKGEIGRYFHDLYRNLTITPRPMLVYTPSIYAFGVHRWQRLILPVRAEDGRIGFYVLCQPHEMQSDLLNAILEKTRDGIMVLHFEREADGFVTDAKVTMANPRATEILGKGRIDLLDHGIRSVVPGLMSNGLWQRCLLVASTRRATNLETEFAENDVQGSFDIALVPFADGILMTFRDITARSRAEKASRATRLQLEQKNELLANRVAELEAERSTTKPETGEA